MVNLKVPPERAIFLMRERIDAIQTIEEEIHGLNYGQTIRWMVKTWDAIREIYGEDDKHYKDINIITLPNFTDLTTESQALTEFYRYRMLDYIDEIEKSKKT
jgi:hypothetical protein